MSSNGAFRKDDELTMQGVHPPYAMVRVDRVSGNNVYVTNLEPCCTMKVGHQFSFDQTSRHKYILFHRPQRKGRKTSARKA